MEDNSIHLGGNIELSGFVELDGGSIIILKKIIGNYVRKMSSQTSNFEGIKLSMKTVHGNQFELNAKLMNNGKSVHSSITDRNVFVAVDGALKKIMNKISK